jgi:hypothetical protein
MATSRTPPDGPDDAEFDAWFDRLAGRVPGPATQAAHREADVLRAALEAEADPQWQAHTSDEAVERQWQALEAQLTAARAAETRALAGAQQAAAPAVQTARPTHTAKPNAWRRWRDAIFGDASSTRSARPARWAGAAALAGIVALAVTLSPMLDPWRDPGGADLSPGQQLQGAPGAGSDTRVQTRATRTPRRDAEALAAALRASPVAAQPDLYSDPNGDRRVVILEVELEGTQLDSAGAVFEAQGLRRPTRVGLARVEFGR